MNESKVSTYQRRNDSSYQAASLNGKQKHHYMVEKWNKKYYISLSDVLCAACMLYEDELDELEFYQFSTTGF